MSDAAASGPFRSVLTPSEPPSAGGFRLPERKAYALPALSTSATAWILRTWMATDPRPTVVVTDGPRTMEALYQDLHTLGDGSAADIDYFPEWEAGVGLDLRGASPELAGDRLQTLLRISEGEASQAFCVLTDIQALLQPVPDPKQLHADSLRLRKGEALDLESFCENLLGLGYVFEPEVMDKGEAARRGGVLDLWPPNQAYPLRVEFFGNEIDSLRPFDPATQRSQDKIPEVRIIPAREVPTAAEATRSFTEYLPSDTRWLLLEPASIRQHGLLYDTSRREGGEEGACLGWMDWQALQAARSGGGVLRIGDGETAPALPVRIQASAGLSDLPGDHSRAEELDRARQAFVDAQRDLAVAGWTVVFCFNTEGARHRFAEAFAAGWTGDRRPHLVLGMLAEGFSVPDFKLSVVSEHDVYGLRKQARNKYDAQARTRRGARPAGARITEWTDIQPGEWVVHIDHGIGKYLGLYQIEFAGQMQEVLSLEYAEGAKLHLPVGQAHLLSRYVGLGVAQPEPHHLGGGRWMREKVVAERAVRDLAAHLLETQAKRDALPGHAFAKDSPWQHEFEATFPHAETVDQETAIAAVKQDMESTKPMDRLICGDVGYGKTEVAMRAAFKAVMDGKQVAMLVPTTILALQHTQSFRERMASFPVRVDMLSRFRTPGEQKDILARLKRGEIDIVIGTHRLASRDVGFKDLGLVIIDEEQRFGVRHKEKLKDLRELVDVLTLSATPIPRTLYMSLTGARDISTIQTAPRERLPVQTDVHAFDPAVVRAAILRELNREGQVFFLHNRVQTIHSLCARLEEWVPEARIVVGHGQMPERRLEDVMRRFAEGEADVLLCTTIIESGVDMPNVNTILIDRADRFGLAELYQLRGRVGRYKHQAHCLLLLSPQGDAKAISRERLRTIQRYSALGSGFKVAMRDLEIRGAGNLLGSQQSGHIASIGFELYCQLLEQSVRKLKKLPVNRIVDVKVRLDFLDMRPDAADPMQACALPETYIEDESLRVEIYRRLASLASREATLRLEEELIDRFGRLPQALRNLLGIARIRIAAASLHVTEIDVRDRKVMMTRKGEYLMRGTKFPRLYQKTPWEQLMELLHILEHWNDGDSD